MNRRGFFKSIAGFAAGCVALPLMGREKYKFLSDDELSIAVPDQKSWTGCKTYSGTSFVADADCNCGETYLKIHGDKVLVACPCKPPRLLDSDGNYEELKTYGIDPTWPVVDGNSRCEHFVPKDSDTG